MVWEDVSASVNWPLCTRSSNNMPVRRQHDEERDALLTR